MTDDITELELLEQKVHELIASYNSLKSENSDLRRQLAVLTAENRTIIDQNTQASLKVQKIIDNLHNINRSE